jgi:hypothetical protein
MVTGNKSAFSHLTAHHCLANRHIGERHKTIDIRPVTFFHDIGHMSGRDLIFTEKYA